MIAQYNEYGSVPSAVCNLIASKIKALDQYVLMMTGENQYTALVHNPLSGETVAYVVQRAANYGSWTVEKQVSQEWNVAVLNEYYVYSNVGYGTVLDLPVHEAMTAHGVSILTITLLFAVLFKGVLFPALLGHKRRGF